VSPFEPLIQVWGIPEGLKWGWLNSVDLILRAGAADVNSRAKNVTKSRRLCEMTAGRRP
jgi:hypothetical protein